ncbi:MAG: hypothetical protein GQ529_00105 [Methyloprofundus sp.]|nr:hypothetical protein [Methyloprofundus sp.]
MTTAIDINALDSLFDNQKKLDDIFNSMFDDDLDSDFSINIHSSESFEQKSSLDIHSTENFSANIGNEMLVQKKQVIPNFVIPVLLEIAVIYYGIMYLI